MKAEYYVYVYIDPRNFEEFYYGKGKGNRKNAHLSDNSDSEKVKTIKAIQNEGLEPIIKIIAKDLTENEAFLIEKTLIWKLGRSLTNVSTGHFSKKFRPHNKLHLNLTGFDFNNGLFYINVGEGPNRDWIDCKKYGFISAGGHPKYSDPIKTINKGDIIAAYLKGKGYVGIGRVTAKAVRIIDFRLKGKSLNQIKLFNQNMFRDSDNENSEFLIKVEWLKAVDKKDGKWKPKSNLFSSQLIKASLDNQKTTIEYLEQEFEVNFSELLNSD